MWACTATSRSHPNWQMYLWGGRNHISLSSVNAKHKIGISYLIVQEKTGTGKLLVMTLRSIIGRRQRSLVYVLPAHCVFAHHKPRVAPQGWISALAFILFKQSMCWTVKLQGRVIGSLERDNSVAGKEMPRTSLRGPVCISAGNICRNTLGMVC